MASLSVDKLQEGLRTKRLGKRVFFSRVVASTNEWAKELASYGAEEGTVAIAETQTAGRGRLGREWVSPKGGLYFSVVLRPQVKPAEAVGLVFVAGLAVAEVLREAYCLKAETKWPNDVLVNGKKVCGVLSEMNSTGEEVNFVVVGVGVNADFDVEKVFPEGLWERTTSLEVEVGRKILLEELFRVLMEKLEGVYERFLKEGFASVLGEWKKYAPFLGHRVEVKSEAEKLEGLALDVDGEGALVLRLEDEALKRVFVGDVSLRMDGLLQFEVGYPMEEFKPYYDKCGIVEQPGIIGGELTPFWEWLLTENPQWLIVWRLDGKIVGHAIWHESSTEEHRKGDKRDEEDREILERLLGRKGDVVELHEVWLMEEYRGRGYGERFFEFFEGFMRERSYDSVIYYAFHPAALAICRKHGYKEAYFERENWHVFYIPLRK